MFKITLLFTEMTTNTKKIDYVRTRRYSECNADVDLFTNCDEASFEKNIDRLTTIDETLHSDYNRDR